ncbi:MAG TPA: asparagine synthase (glutamine-hydrolyzing) [Candidatus Binatia bacterium]|nr:asparagine synthase (glutamine-hydrolyzing) [Candidatus Binatia bacterium]
MCGIFGIAAEKAEIPEGLLARGTQSLAHRGPDDSGTIFLRDGANQIGLGNRRLAILDLSSLGHQPMQDAATGNWIVYNGEIYNFRQVRGELEEDGVRFVTHCDTEVLLKAYVQWGEACLPRFRGMFAFALWDATRHHLFLARDPMGIKPLYYAQSGRYFCFASEVRSLLGTGLMPGRLHAAGLTNFLTFGSAYDPLTLVEDVQALPAGHCLTWNNGAVVQSRYWDLIEAPSSDLPAILAAKDKTVVAAQLRELLEEAVSMQLVSDVPVGVFLSGGIDSSALVSIISGEGVTPSTFSIVFKESEFSEAQHSRAVAQAFHTDHHEIEVSQSDVLAAIPDALAAMDLPTMDGINTYFVSRETRKAGVKVALSGLGGDEVFAGYASFRTVPRFESTARKWGWVPESGRAAIASTFSALAPETDRNRKLALLMSDGSKGIHPYFVSRMLFTPEQQRVLALVHDDSVLQTAMAPVQEILESSRPLDPINRVSYLESRCYMLNTLLRDSDFMSMSQGLELRVPLIDHQLAQNVMALPGKWKLNGTPKKLLVESLRRPLPKDIVDRPKRGFTLPFEHWMRQELKSEIEPVLRSSRIEKGPLGGVLRGDAVQNVWQAFLRRRVSWSRPWSLYVLQRWCERHLS